MSLNENRRKTPTRRKPTPRSKAGSHSGSARGDVQAMPREAAESYPIEQAQQQKASVAAQAGDVAINTGSFERTRQAAASQDAQMPTAEPTQAYREPRRTRQPLTQAQQRRAEFASDMRQALVDPRKAKTTSSARKGVTQRSPMKKSRLVIIGIVVVAALVAVVMLGLTFCQNDSNKVKSVEQWRHTVKQACIDCEVDTQWTDAILALMAVESGGNVDVRSVEGVAGDLMQAAEGAYGDIVKGGSAKYGVDAQTPEASIYAGVLEFKQNYKLWKKYLKGIGVSETGEIQLIIQGYNFGADGWYQWCKKNKVKTYTVEKAREYSETQMPEGAKGTPTHGEKWLGYYERIRG